MHVSVFSDDFRKNWGWSSRRPTTPMDRWRAPLEYHNIRITVTTVTAAGVGVVGRDRWYNPASFALGPVVYLVYYVFVFRIKHDNTIIYRNNSAVFVNDRCSNSNL